MISALFYTTNRYKMLDSDAPIPAMLNRERTPHPTHTPRPIGAQAVRGTKKYAYRIDARDTMLNESAVAICAPSKDSFSGYTIVMYVFSNEFRGRTINAPKNQLRNTFMNATIIIILAGTTNSPWDWKYRLTWNP